MTPEAAIYAFLNSFAIPAYATSSVPSQDSPEWKGFPYMAYDLVIGEDMGVEVNMPVNVWYRTASEKIPNDKVREIHDRIGMGGIFLPCDGGALWVKRGSPWAQAMEIEGEDDMVKRRYININIEFLIAE